MEKINTKYGITIIVTLFLVISVWFLYYLRSSKVDFNDDGNTDFDTIKEISFNGEETPKDEFYLEEFDKDIREVSFVELSNSLYQPKWWDNLKDKIEYLKASNDYDDKQKATYLESFVWNYKDAKKDREALCQNATENDIFCKEIQLKLTSYFPEDTEGNYLDWVKLYLDWEEVWNLVWKNNLTLENNFLHRISAEKEWYLDFFWKYYVNSWVSSTIQESFSPKLSKAYTWVTIKSNESAELFTYNYTFFIKPNTFIDKNGNVYNWDVKVYLFDLDSSNNDENPFGLDAFTENLSYAWGSMVTFWMPYLTAYDINGNRLYIWTEITWKWQIQNTEKQPDIDLVNVPKNVFLSKVELEEYKIPPFWNLDITSWVWKESKMKILDTEWNYEFIYN